MKLSNLRGDYVSMLMFTRHENDLSLLSSFDNPYKFIVGIYTFPLTYKTYNTINRLLYYKL